MRASVLNGFKIRSTTKQTGNCNPLPGRQLYKQERYDIRTMDTNVYIQYPKMPQDNHSSHDARNPPQVRFSSHKPSSEPETSEQKTTLGFLSALTKKFRCKFISSDEKPGELGNCPIPPSTSPAKVSAPESQSSSVSCDFQGLAYGVVRHCPACRTEARFLFLVVSDFKEGAVGLRC
jgi:hypothetical protein